MLMNELVEQNITIVSNGTTSFASSTNIKNDSSIFEPEVRIYFLNMYSNHARRVLCAVSIGKAGLGRLIDQIISLQAANLQDENPDPQLYVPGYVWITLGWYRDQWWTEEVSREIIPGCDDTTLEPLINQTIGIQQANSAPDRQAPTDVNLVN